MGSLKGKTVGLKKAAGAPGQQSLRTWTARSSGDSATAETGIPGVEHDSAPAAPVPQPRRRRATALATDPAAVRAPPGATAGAETPAEGVEERWHPVLPIREEEEPEDCPAGQGPEGAAEPSSGSSSVSGPRQSLRERLASRRSLDSSLGLGSSSAEPAQSQQQAIPTSLRERLASRRSLDSSLGLGSSSAEPAQSQQQAMPTSSPQTSSSSSGLLDQNPDLPEHKKLGGISLQWRLLLRPDKPPRKSLSQASMSSSPDVGAGTQEEGAREGQTDAPVGSPTQAAAADNGGPPSPGAQSRSSSCSCSPQKRQRTSFSTPPQQQRRGGGEETPTPPAANSAASVRSARSGASDGSPVEGKDGDRGAGHDKRHESSSSSTSFPQQSTATSEGPVRAAVPSVAKLKAALAARGVDFTGCVEKADLHALWLRSLHGDNGGNNAASHSDVRAAPESRLPAKPSLSSAETAAALAAAAAAAARSGPYGAAAAGLRGMASPQLHGRASSQPPATESAAAQNRQGQQPQEQSDDVQKEVKRILSLRHRQQAFSSPLSWALEVLRAEGRDAAAAQRGYRVLMKRLHPDKVEQCPRVAEAALLVREARDAVDRSLSRLRPPLDPRSLRAVPVCEVRGRRRLRLSWTAPLDRENKPVSRYVVALLDPACGRVLTVAHLEPDYDKKLGRFQPIEELTSYDLDELELQKMPRFWQQQVATVQVAAGNDSGQSPWATLEVKLCRQ